MMEQEHRSGIRYWCDRELSEAFTKLVLNQGGIRSAKPVQSFEPGDASRPGRPARPAASIPPTPKPPTSSGPQSGSSGKAEAPRRFARPPSRLNPDAPVRSPSASDGKSKPARPKWGPAPKATGREKSWQKKLASIEEEVKSCRLCGLCEGRANTVFGTGEATVPLVFVGEAPGAEEDRQGLPFVGRAGALLTRIIEAMGLSREQVYICNVLKCRPPGNRDPHPDEVASCSPYLDRQLALLKPAVICTLGRHSTMRLTGQAVAMKAIRGNVFEYRGFKVVPTYHPAALLRNPSLKALVWEDVQKVRGLLDAQKGAS
jgi:DNA polymerase